MYSLHDADARLVHETEWNVAGMLSHPEHSRTMEAVVGCPALLIADYNDCIGLVLGGTNQEPSHDKAFPCSGWITMHVLRQEP